MNREQLIEETFQKVNKLPDEKIREINHFAEFLLSKIEDAIDLEGIAQITSNSQSFDFLRYDEDLYTVNDVIEKYK
jgi:antirestriction protein